MSNGTDKATMKKQMSRTECVSNNKWLYCSLLKHCYRTQIINCRQRLKMMKHFLGLGWLEVNSFKISESTFSFYYSPFTIPLS